MDYTLSVEIYSGSDTTNEVLEQIFFDLKDNFLCYWVHGNARDPLVPISLQYERILSLFYLPFLQGSEVFELNALTILVELDVVNFGILLVSWKL